MRARNDRLLRSLCCLSKGRRGFIWRKKETKGKNRIGKNSEESSLKPLAEEENSRKSHESDDNEASENSEDEKSSYETERNRENRKKGRNRKKTDAKKGSRKLKKAKSGESGEESSGGKKSRRTVSYSRETAAGEQEQLENEDIKEKGDEEDSVKTARE